MRRIKWKLGEIIICCATVEHKDAHNCLLLTEINWNPVHYLTMSFQNMCKVVQICGYLINTSPRWPAKAPSTYSSVLANWALNKEEEKVIKMS